MFNVRDSHQLIDRSQTYVLDRKCVTIHSSDRDVNKWPYSNHFEVTLPQALHNVQSMRLLEIQVPSNYYSFSNELQNTKFKFRFSTVSTAWSTSSIPAIYTILNNAGDFEITIQNGFYDPDEIASEIQNRMNKAITDYLFDNGVTYVYDKFVVANDKAGMKIFFGNTIDSFVLLFSERMEYTLQQCEQATAWERYTQWGFPFFVGFEKDDYTSITSNDELFFFYKSADPWLTYSDDPSSNSVYYVEAPFIYRLFGENTIYMELEKYNTIDEIVPFSQSTNSTYNNDYSGRVNSAFAKIPITILPYGQVFDSRNGFLQNVTHFDPPVEKIQKVKVKFRNHVGILVDFQDLPINFTIEFNMLKNEIGKDYKLRIPFAYTL